jgi:hypothetical protein
MFGLIRRVLHLERLVIARDKQIALLNAEHSDLDRRLDEQMKANKCLRMEMVGVQRDPKDPIAAALQAVLEDLGGSEWATPEHAQEILQEIIEKHYTRGWTALVTAGVKRAS